jgi:hypothetical protein
MKGFDFGWFFGVLNTWTNISFINFRCGSLSKAASNDKNGLEYFRQFPVNLSSSVVCISLT